MAEKKSKYLQLIVIAAQMGATIFLGAFIGKKLDEKFPSQKKWFTMGLTIFSVFISLYMVLKQLNEINKKDEK